MVELSVSQCWRDVHDVLSAGIDRVLLYGPPGTGKTYAALHHLVQGTAERLVCTEDMTSGDVLGMWMPSGREQWRFHEGPAIRAWRGVDGTGGRLVVDEIDRASGDALSTLLAVTDSVASARWRSPETGEWVTPGASFSVVLTSNVDAPSEIPEALRDRFSVAIRIDAPHPAAVTSLSEDLRAPALAGSLGASERRLSLRSFYAFDHLRDRVGSHRAAALVFGEAADDIVDALRIAAMAS